MDGRYIEYINRGEYTYNVRDVEAERLANKVAEFQQTPDNDHYPTEKLVKDSLDGIVNSINTTIEDVSVTSIVDTLPQTGEAGTDYYVKTADSEVYLHYRWHPAETIPPEEEGGEPTVIDGYYYVIGGDSYTKAQIDNLLATRQTVANKVTAFQTTPDDTHYPSEKLVHDALELLHSTISNEMDALELETSVVVNELPNVASASTTLNYVLKKGNGALLYKVIDGAWRMIGGALVSVTDELPTDGSDNPSGDAFTDYYIPTQNENVYLHYRWMDTYTIPAADPNEEDTVVEGHFYSIGADAYSKSEIDSKLSAIRSDHSTDVTNINTQLTQIGRAVQTNASDIEDLQAAQRTYTLGLTQGESDQYILHLYDNDSGNTSVILPATGGGGGGTGATTLTVTRITQSPVIVTPTDSVVIQFLFSSVDGDGETVDGSYTLKVGSTVIKSESLVQGQNSIDVTEFCAVGTQKFTLTVTDAGGSTNVKTWTVQVVDVRLETTFNDKVVNTIGRTVNFTYTPYGAVSKVIHFKLDGQELESVTTTSSGILQSYPISPRTHGAHLLETWATASVNGVNIETTHIFKDIIWYNEDLDAPVIGCIYRYDYYGAVDVKQYNTLTIPYVVYDPRTENPTVSLSVDGTLVNEQHLSAAVNSWAYKSDVVQVHVLTITCRTTTLTIRVNVTDLGYDIAPITANLAFDFNPTGLTNSSVNRLWVDENDANVAMTVSNNFDWINGGYKTDSEGSPYFCVKSGTRAYFSYNLFGTNPKQNGAEFKVIFKTTNVSDKDATFLTCLSTSANDNAGLKMNTHEAYYYTSSDSLYTPYSEEDIIEFEYNVNTIDTENADATSFVMTYEDGVASRPLLYSNDSGYLLHQINPVPITVGSDDCDVHIYRMKAYTSALTDSNILANFIADARDSETMIARYERNQIYDENNNLTPDSVADACPDLKVIKISCPHFTNDKADYVKYTTVECVHRNGDSALDNWTFSNGYHAGQGTTSNRYGLAGRNIDIIFGFDGENQVVSKIPLESDYISSLTLGDGTRYTGRDAKVALTRTSEPNTWFNIKVNIASSENANNALLQKRYNDYIPYKTPAQKRNPKLKNDMEFVNCVVFIRETDPDPATHREFADNDWHFYAIGNIGDSKKTDNTRVNDPEDMAEFVVEISDNTLPNAYFDTGVYYTANGGTTYDPAEAVLNTNLDIPSYIVYPITQAQWQNANNLKHAALYDDWDGSFEFRYDMGTKDGETIESEAILAQQELSKQVFRNLYEFIITSTDADFVSHLGDWFITESPLYWYLFTERYTMIDNRAKNSFWHYGKTYITEAEALEMGDDAVNYTVDNAAAAINNGYRFDLWCYDTDSALGIDNNGELNLTYGKEDVDYKTDGVPSSGYVFNAADSVFWRRIRKLMDAQLRTMYRSREALNCWTATSLITEFDNWQDQFPEELWRLDIERKYLRPYYSGNPVAGIAATDNFLRNMMNGRKKYQRRQFERAQEIYIGTKYFGTNQCADTRAISFRCNTPQTAVVRPDYTLRITPYSDMYLTVAYGNSTPQAVRAKGGTEYTFTTNMTVMDDTMILIHCAENIQGINDLSACYIRANDFSSASKLKTLVIGSTVQEYSNPFITTLSIKDNTLLEYLDIRNCPNLSGSLNLSGCPNLITLYAEGTSLAGVSFASNGNIQTAHLPETITSLTLIELNYLSDFQVESYDNLIAFVNEYGAIDPLPIVLDAIDTLQVVRIVGVDWVFSNTTTLNRIAAMNSSFLSGRVEITGVIRNAEIERYNSLWKDLEVIYDPNNIIPQYTVTYVNMDGNVLYEYLIDAGGVPIDPVAQGLIDTPTMPQTDQYTYTFRRWDDISGSTAANRTVTATYTATVRTYTVRWFGKRGDQTPLEVATVNYGQEAVYTGDRPTDTSGESGGIYRLFNGWEASTGSVRSDMSVYPVWETSSLPTVGTELKDMTVGEVYAVCVSDNTDRFFEDKDHVDIKLGRDFNFNNVEGELLLEERYFDGSDYVDTGIALFDAEAPSFTLAIDYEFLASNSSNSTLAACFDSVTSDGFRLLYGANPVIEWLGAQSQVSSGGYRNIVVLRHVHGTKNLVVYSQRAAGETTYVNSKAEDAYITISEKVGGRSVSTNQTLVFGAQKFAEDGGFGFYAKGYVHWCKVWHDDLGEENCKALATWTHETIRMEFAGKDRFALGNSPSRYAHGTFLSNDISEMAYYFPSSTGGWAEVWLNNYFQKIVYKAFPELWQSAIKLVSVKSTAGNGSTAVTSSKCYVFPPALAEIYSTTTSSYVSERSSGTTISYYSNNASRAKFARLFRDIDGTQIISEANDPTELTRYTVKTGDIWYLSAVNGYFIYVDGEEARKHTYLGGANVANAIENNLIYTGTNRECYLASDGGVWIRAVEWGTRTPYVNSSIWAYIAANGSFGGSSGSRRLPFMFAV